ncbi:MAG: trehalose-phosphatase, partial [Polyangiales bacterium]
VHKGIIVEQILRTHEGSPVIVAIGDDRTDEDLFAAVPEGGITIHVGQAETDARFRLGSPVEVRKLLADVMCT